MVTWLFYRFGNLQDVEKAGGLHRYLEKLHTKYGDIVKIWFENTPFVSTASPESFKSQVKLYDKPGNKVVLMVNSH